MPYLLVSAKARTKALEALWSDVELGNMDINQIFKTYSRVVLTLSHSIEAGTFYLDLSKARNQIGVYIGTKKLNDWLASLGNASLPTEAQAPSFKNYPVRYANAWMAGYKIRPVDGTRHPDAQLPERDKHDLLLEKEGVALKPLANYAMVTVNGFVHRVAGTQDGLVIVDGGRTGHLCNDNHVGIMSFKDVGPLQYVPITSGMVYKQDDTQKLSDYAMIHSPIDLDDKVVLMVIGGFLHVLDGAYDVIGNRAIRINVDTLSYVDRVYESMGRINLDTMGLTPSSNNEMQFALDEIRSDRAVQAYLSLPQSFFVVMAKTDLYVIRHPVEQTGLPGRYYSSKPWLPYPLISAWGCLHDYTPLVEREKVVIATNPVWRYNRNYHTSVWTKELSVSPNNYSFDPCEHAPAYLLEIGRVA